MASVVILQPSFLPWRGYFHQIWKADVFVFYDCVQYDKHGWRNRNVIKTNAGKLWLTVPVSSSNIDGDKYSISEVPIDWKRPWARKQLASIKQAYSKAPFFSEYKECVESIFSRQDRNLSDLVIESTIQLSKELGISGTEFVKSSDMQISGSKTDRVMDVLSKLGATKYISGPSASAYLDEEKFEQAGIELEYLNYDYPEYPQLHGEYLDSLSILDLLFNVGPSSGDFIWG